MNCLEKTVMYVIIVAAGSGWRMSSDIPKQFLELCGKPILMYAIEAFVDAFEDIKTIVVLPQSHFTYWDKLCVRYNFNVPHQTVEGGSQRFHSVKNGLALIRDDDGLVAIHDGARPLVSRETIINCFNEAEKFGNAVPVTVPVDSFREAGSEKSRMLDRSTLRMVQTPQVFKIALIKNAYEQRYQQAFTDDSSVFEAAGNKVHLTEGNSENLKITTTHDFIIAEALLQAHKT